MIARFESSRRQACLCFQRMVPMACALISVPTGPTPFVVEGNSSYCIQQRVRTFFKVTPEKAVISGGGANSQPIFWRAGEGTRTLDINLGKVALYQLSYTRIAELISMPWHLFLSTAFYKKFETPCADKGFAQRLRTGFLSPPDMRAADKIDGIAKK
jgi:hypothetical protein